MFRILDRLLLSCIYLPNFDREAEIICGMQDGRISYSEFAAMMKTGTDWRKASRQYSRERYNNLSLELMKDGSIQSNPEGR